MHFLPCPIHFRQATNPVTSHRSLLDSTCRWQVFKESTKTFKPLPITHEGLVFFHEPITWTPPHLNQIFSFASPLSPWMNKVEAFYHFLIDRTVNDTEIQSKTFHGEHHVPSTCLCCQTVVAFFLDPKAKACYVLCKMLKCLKKSTASTHLSHHTHLRAMKRLLSVCELCGHVGPAVSISASSAGNQAPSVG